jgi:MFS family permease
VALTGVLISSALGLFTIPFFGALSDRVGRKPVYMFGSASLFAFPFFWLLNAEANVLIWLAIVLANSVGVYAMFSPQAAFFSELFDTRVRYSGLALASRWRARSPRPSPAASPSLGPLTCSPGRAPTGP